MLCYLLRVVYILFILALSTSISYGDIYKFTDSNGVIHYTNVPVDSRYKKFMSESFNGYNGSAFDDKYSYAPLFYQEIVARKSRKYNIHPALVKAIIKAESNWNPYAISRKGAKGLMQLMPRTALDMGVRNSMNPEQNIEGGTKYISMLLNLFSGNLDLALAAYNAGPGAVKKYGGIPPYRETINYVKKVNKFFITRSGGNPVRPLSSRIFTKKSRIYKTVMKDGTVLYTNYRK